MLALTTDSSAAIWSSALVVETDPYLAVEQRHRGRYGTALTHRRLDLPRDARVVGARQAMADDRRLQGDDALAGCQGIGNFGMNSDEVVGRHARNSSLMRHQREQPASRASHVEGMSMHIATVGDVVLDVIVDVPGGLNPDDDAEASISLSAGGQAANVAAWAAAPRRRGHLDRPTRDVRCRVSDRETPCPARGFTSTEFRSTAMAQWCRS